MTTINDFETELSATREMLSERLGASLPAELRLRQTTPPADETTRLFCRSAGFDRLEYLDVRPTSAARPGRSYDNVREHIVRCGGCVVHGWIVRAVPILFYEAEYHAVWQSPDVPLWTSRRSPAMKPEFSLRRSGSPSLHHPVRRPGLRKRESRFSIWKMPNQVTKNVCRYRDRRWSATRA